VDGKRRRLSKTIKYALKTAIKRSGMHDLERECRTLEELFVAAPNSIVPFVGRYCKGRELDSKAVGYFGGLGQLPLIISF